jgi:hypothetical protein
MMRQKMITVKMQLYSWISSSLGESENGGSTLTKKVKEGTTFGGFFTELANSSPEFRKLVFDPETGRMNDEVVIMLNGRLEQFNIVIDSEIKDRDVIILSPVLIGG